MSPLLPVRLRRKVCGRSPPSPLSVMVRLNLVSSRPQEKVLLSSLPQAFPIKTSSSSEFGSKMTASTVETLNSTVTSRVAFPTVEISMRSPMPAEPLNLAVALRLTAKSILSSRRAAASSTYMNPTVTPVKRVAIALLTILAKSWMKRKRKSE